MTPTQELVMEVLAARFRLGGKIWTFRSVHSRTIRELEQQGLLFSMNGLVEGSIRAGMTDLGKNAFLSEAYTPPRVTELAFPGESAEPRSRQNEIGGERSDDASVALRQSAQRA